ncbi:MAG: hypothetical protein HY366_02180 [Candidatus Aenigmarchaeota archaeon]|nr:hypothetical protein [Candidatus Aenigmarchaeota archaeon]
MAGELNIPSQDEIRKNIQEWSLKMSECHNTGGYRGVDDGRLVAHLGPIDDQGNDGRRHYYTCTHCGMPYTTNLTHEDVRARQETLDRVFTI